jgi:hypothetical protein
MLKHGGAYRSLAILPGPASAGSTAVATRELGPNASVLAGVGHDVILCQEGWDAPLSSIAVDIIERRRDYADFASRVRTRSDIAWTPLASPAATFAAPAGAAATPSATQVL